MSRSLFFIFALVLGIGFYLKTIRQDGRGFFSWPGAK